MPGKSTIYSAHGSVFRSLGNWNTHGIRSPFSASSVNSRRFATDSSPSAPALDDQVTAPNPVRIRKVTSFPVADRRDVYVNSLDATVEAHRVRGQKGNNDAQTSFEKPAIVRMIGRGRSDPSPSGGERHWASFEDFRAQYKPGDPEWERRLGADIEVNGHSPTSNAIPSSTARETGGSDGIAASELESKAPPPKPNRRGGDLLRQRKDYTVGKEQAVIARYASHRSKRISIPNLENSRTKQGSEEVLKAQILAFEDFQDLSSLDREVMDKLLDQVFALIQSILPQNGIVQLHGSFATRLANLHSDVDINIPLFEDAEELLHRGPSPGRAQNRRKRLQILRDVQKAFCAQMTSIDTELIGAQYPLLTIRDLETEVTYQISCGRRTAATTEIVRAVLDEYPSIRPLYVLLRYTLVIRGLNDAKFGGVGSYSLFVMILTALKHSKSLLRDDNLAQQLLAVLEFWGSADVRQTGYAAVPTFTFPKYEDSEVDPGNIWLDEGTTGPIAGGIAHIQAQNREIKKKHPKARRFPRHPSQLSLQDPANPTNDLGFPSYRMPDVIETLQQLGRRLREAMKRWDATPLERRDDLMSDMLQPLINSNFDALRKKRQALRRATSSTSQSITESQGREIQETGDPSPIRTI